MFKRRVWTRGFALALLIGLGLAWLVWAVVWFAHDLPDLEPLKKGPSGVRVTLLYADGSEMVHIGGAPASLKDWPAYLPQAVLTALKVGPVTGAAMPLAESLVAAEPGIRRALQVPFVALILQHRLGREGALVYYLARADFGAGIYGVDAAAHRFLGKAAAEVDLAEAAVLAAQLTAPHQASPIPQAEPPPPAAGEVLSAMADAGLIGRDEAEAALRQPVLIADHAIVENIPNHFAAWALDEVARLVGRGEGEMTVLTTLDRGLQAAAAARTAAILGSDEARETRVGQAALVAMSPDGAVRAMIGGRERRRFRFNRATQSAREPGSAFALFVYLARMEAGVNGGEPDGGRAKAIAMARRLGIDGELIEESGPSIGRLTLLELASAYGTLPNGGNEVHAFGVLEVRDGKGRILFLRPRHDQEAVLPLPLAIAMSRMLEGMSTTAAFDRARLDRPWAGMPGSTLDFRDAWFLGYTADLTVGVWMGNDGDVAMDLVTGSDLPAELWRSFMDQAHEGRPPAPLALSTKTPETWDDLRLPFIVAK